MRGDVPGFPRVKPFRAVREQEVLPGKDYRLRGLASDPMGYSLPVVMNRRAGGPLGPPSR